MTKWHFVNHHQRTCEYAAGGPHVDWGRIKFRPEQHVWRSVPQCDHLRENIRKQSAAGFQEPSRASRSSRTQPPFLGSRGQKWIWMWFSWDALNCLDCLFQISGVTVGQLPPREASPPSDLEVRQPLTLCETCLSRLYPITREHQTG